MKHKYLAIALCALALGASGAAAQTVVNSDVTSDTTWSGTVVLSRPIFVKNGATLTINAGTIVRGQPRTAAPLAGSTVGTPGALVVTRAGRVVADGSPSNPIIMTTAVTDNDSDGVADDADNNGFSDLWSAGDTFLDDTPLSAPLSPLANDGSANVSLWGGVVLLGSAPTNLAEGSTDCSVGWGQCTVEGLTVPGFPAADAAYGGKQPHDSSGSMSYVSIRHAGDEIGASNELNGLTMAGVGDGTRLSHIEIYANFDDGFEWFGGTVNADHLGVFFVGDDQFDIDQGYSGTLQFLVGMAPFFAEGTGSGTATPFGSDSGDLLSEFDGTDAGNVASEINHNTAQTPTPAAQRTAAPLSQPAIWNLTLIGAQPVSSPAFPAGASNGYFAAGADNGINMRNSFAGTIMNTLLLNVGSAQAFTIDTSDGASEPTTTVANVNAGYLSIGCTTIADSGAPGANENNALANGDAFQEVVLGANSTSSANAVNTGVRLVNEDLSFNPRGNAAGKLSSTLALGNPINPRPVTTGFPTPKVAGCGAPTGPGLDRAATYRGAFDPSAAAPLWTDGWTALSIGGLLQ